MKRYSRWQIIRKMQIETTMRQYLISASMATIQKQEQTKKPENSKWWWRCGEKGTPVRHWWACKRATIKKKNSMAVPQRIKNRIIIWSSNFTSGYVAERIERRVSKRLLYTCIHSSIIHYLQKVGTIQVIINRYERASKMWSTHIMGYYSVLKRKKILTHATVWCKEPWRHYA